MSAGTTQTKRIPAVHPPTTPSHLGHLSVSKVVSCLPRPSPSSQWGLLKLQIEYTGLRLKPLAFHYFRIKAELLSGPPGPAGSGSAPSLTLSRIHPGLLTPSSPTSILEEAQVFPSQCLPQLCLQHLIIGLPHPPPGGGRLGLCSSCSTSPVFSAGNTAPGTLRYLLNEWLSGLVHEWLGENEVPHKE